MAFASGNYYFYMNSIAVSIIIPVYNAAAYLTECIRSVQQQTLRNIEIIIINDGSADESHQLITSFAVTDPRIVYINGPNAGVSAARNKGINVAKGEFIGFADADDWMEPNMLQAVYDNAKEQDADLSVCNVNVCEPGGHKSVRLALKTKTLDVSANREAALLNLMRFKYDFANWNKIYSAKIIQEKKLFFNEGMNVYEDLLFNLSYFQYAEKITSTERPLYNYRMHAASVMGAATHDAVRENNLLFEGFNRFCTERNTVIGLDTCNAELRRGIYYAVIPKIWAKIRVAENDTSKRAKLFVSELKRFNAGLFAYSKKELSGVSGIKKKMLLKKKFHLFVAMAVARNIIKPKSVVK